MEEFLGNVAQVNDTVNTFVWVKVGLIILLGAGLLLTVATKFFQFGHLGLWWKNTFGSLFKKGTHESSEKSISPFQAICTALAATVGTGNVAGVAAAICIGGAGAVFWMWLAALLGMMTKYAEIVLSLYFRRKNSNGEFSGGAMYYLQDGVGGKKGGKVIGKILAILFAVFTILAAFGIGCMSQSNNIVLNIESAFPIKALSGVAFGEVTWYRIIIGALLVVFAVTIILGGLKRVASFAEKVVPVMVILYTVGSLVIIGINYANILPALRSIFVTAFTPVAAAGGGIGYLISTVITQGCKRGVFSNEAGLGSSALVHASTAETEPAKQGMWGIFEVFVDTIVVCTMTALVVLTSGVFDLHTATSVSGNSSATLVAEAFNSVFSFGGIGAKFVAIALFLFAFTTILGWDQYGAKAWEYLFGTKSTVIFKVIHCLMVFAGAILTNSLAWDISDTFNGLMMVPNLIGLVVLFPLVSRITKNYLDRQKGAKVAPMISYRNPEE